MENKRKAKNVYYSTRFCISVDAGVVHLTTATPSEGFIPRAQAALILRTERRREDSWLCKEKLQ